MRQVSPESLAIFDFILEVHASCSGAWDSLIDLEIGAAGVRQLLTYAAAFLSNVGNYYVCDYWHLYFFAHLTFEGLR